MNLLSTLTLAADEEQLRLRPLSEHAAAAQNEHLRRHYALLLAAVLTAQPVVSEPQTRLLRLLLDALKLGDIRGPLFEQARELTPEPLLEAARLIREAGFAHHLVLDTLVLLRLDAPLGDEAARLVGELATFLGLDEAALATRAGDASEILGLNANEAGYGARDVGDEGGSAGEADKFAVERLSLAEYWPGQLRQPLSIEALRAGLQGGLWVLDADLAVHFPWQANNAVLFFRNGAVLNTFAEKGEIKLEECRLLDAALTFQGKNSSITLQRCDWQGDYAPTAKRSALHSHGQDVTITDCRFSTRNARAIAVEGGRLNLTGSHFTHCGNANLDGGAVWHDSYNRIIQHCSFDRCLAAYGGALWVQYLGAVNRCEFIACESRALQNRKAGDIAVYTASMGLGVNISNCSFRQTSLLMRCVRTTSSCAIVSLTRFQDANVYHGERNFAQSLFDNCTFDGGQAIQEIFE